MQKGHWASKILLVGKRLRKLLSYKHMCYLLFMEKKGPEGESQNHRELFLILET